MRVGLRFRWAALLLAISGVIPILLLHRNATSNNSATAPSRRRIKDVPVSIPPRRKGRRRNREISNSTGNLAVASHGAELLTRNEYDDNGDDDGSNETIILSRHPSRIPGYVSGSNATYFGYVMRDFASRVLSRHIVGSGADVLIVSKDLPPRQQSRPYSLDMKSNHSVGPSFLRHSMAEGHRVHGIGGGNAGNDISSQVSKWWESFSTSRPPSWILLAVFDPPIGSEDAVISSKAASRILSGCTVTYILFRVSSTWPRGSTAIVRGKDAVDALVGHGYKVSVLSSSHSIDLFEPNSLLDGDSLSHFLLLGAKKARQSSVGRSVAFNAYLFATQGLDLAIPSQREYVTPLGAGRTKVDKSSGEVLLSLKSCKAEARVEFRSARERKGMDRNDEGAKTSAASPSRIFLAHFSVFCGNKAVTDPSALSEMWMSAETPDLSEAVCVRINGCGTREKGASACNTRILPLKEGRLVTHANSSMPNLLVVMIDPISRPLFYQSLPRTRQLLIDAGFTGFDNYTAVGDNSGPNQAALYSGQALSSRQDISSQDKRKFRWIWDDLRDAGYATYKAEDGCIRNSNMVQSIGPRTSHGSVIHQMSCVSL